MDVNKMLEELQQERLLLDQAIIAFERLAQGGRKRVGRPPSWMVEAKKRVDPKKPAPKKETTT